MTNRDLHRAQIAYFPCVPPVFGTGVAAQTKQRPFSPLQSRSFRYCLTDLSTSFTRVLRRSIECKAQLHQKLEQISLPAFFATCNAAAPLERPPFNRT
jgi:hypothetical protein